MLPMSCVIRVPKHLIYSPMLKDKYSASYALNDLYDSRTAVIYIDNNDHVPRIIRMDNNINAQESASDIEAVDEQTVYEYCIVL